MASYTDIIDAVYIVTNRPDLVSETAREIRKATMMLHNLGYWKQDLKEAIIALPTQTVFRYQIDTTSSDFTRFRRIFSANPYSPSPNLYNYPPIKILTADNIFDDYNLEKVNYCYQAGLNLNFVLSTVGQYLRIIYHGYPDTAAATYSSWIATQLDDYIVDEACKNIFKMLGKDEEFQKFEKITQENEQALQGIGGD